MILSFKLQMYLSHGLLPSPIGFLVENSKSNPALLNYGKFDLLSSSKSSNERRKEHFSLAQRNAFAFYVRNFSLIFNGIEFT